MRKKKLLKRQVVSALMAAIMVASSANLELLSSALEISVEDVEETEEAGQDVVEMDEVEEDFDSIETIETELDQDDFSLTVEAKEIAASSIGYGDEYQCVEYTVKAEWKGESLDASQAVILKTQESVVPVSDSKFTDLYKYYVKLVEDEKATLTDEELDGYRGQYQFADSEFSLYLLYPRDVYAGYELTDVFEIQAEGNSMTYQECKVVVEAAAEPETVMVETETVAIEPETVETEMTPTEQGPEAIEPETVVTESETVEPETTPAESETVEPETTPAESETVEPETTPVESETVEPETMSVESETTEPETVTETETVEPETVTETENVEPETIQIETETVVTEPESESEPETTPMESETTESEVIQTEPESETTESEVIQTEPESETVESETVQTEPESETVEPETIQTESETEIVAIETETEEDYLYPEDFSLQFSQETISASSIGYSDNEYEVAKFDVVADYKGELAVDYNIRFSASNAIVTGPDKFTKLYDYYKQLVDAGQITMSEDELEGYRGQYQFDGHEFSVYVLYSREYFGRADVPVDFSIQVDDAAIVTKTAFVQVYPAETEVQTEPESEFESESESQVVVDEPETEPEEETELVQYGDYPTNGSTVQYMQMSVWTGDIGFKPERFIGWLNYDLTEVSVVCTDDGGFDLATVGEVFTASYTVTLKEYPDYSWVVFVPYEVIDGKALATARSSEFDSLLENEQGEGFRGIVPTFVGDSVDAESVTLCKGDDLISLTELDLGYDRTHYSVTVEDDGGFSTDEVGNYSVVYRLTSLANGDYWFVNCTVKVRSITSISDSSGAVLHVASSSLQADLYSGEGAMLGSRFIGSGLIDVNTATIVASSRYDDGSAVLDITVYEYGEEVDSSEYLESAVRGEEDGTETITLKSGADWAGIVVSIRNTTENTVGKSVGGFVDEELAAMAEEAAGAMMDTVSDDRADGEIQATAETRADAYGVYHSIDTTGSYYVGVYGNYNIDGSHNPSTESGTIYFSSTTQAALATFLSNNNLQLSAGYSIPTAGWIHCISGTSFEAWPQGVGYYLYFAARINAGADGNASSITFYYQGSSSGRQVLAGSTTLPVSSAVGTLSITKRSDARQFVTKTDRVDITTAFKVYESKALAIADIAEEDPSNSIATIAIEPANSGTYTSTGSAVLPIGTYYVREIRRAAGHLDATDKILGPYTVTKDAVTEVGEPGIGVRNVAIKYSGTIVHKVDGDTNAPLAGAVFRVEFWSAGKSSSGEKLYTWYFQTDSNGDIVYDSSHRLASVKIGSTTYTSDALIMTYSPGGEYRLPVGVLYVTEVKAPDGYVLPANPKTKYIRLSENTEDEYNSMATLEYENTAEEEPEPFKLIIKKYITGTTTPLEDTQFKLYKWNSTTKDWDSTSGPVWDEEEQAFVREIKTANKYKVVEHKAPTGYVNAGWSAEFTFKDSDTGAARIKTYTVYNDKMPYWYCKLLVNKKDADTGANLKGAEYAIYTDAACTHLWSKCPEIGPTNGNGNATTGAIYIGQYAEAPSLTLYVKETTAPEGYQGTSVIATATMRMTSNTVKSVPSAVPNTTVNFTNKREIYYGAVKIIKTDSTSGAKVPGAHYAVYRDAACTTLVDSSMSNLITGTDGTVTSKTVQLNSYQETWYVKETQAPTGYTLNSTVKTVIVTGYTSTATVVPAEITFSNNRIPGTGTLTKLDDKGVAVAGAVYRLEYASGTFIGNYTTNSNGQFTISNLAWNSYKLYEITAPTGYNISTKVFNFTVDATHLTHTFSDTDTRKLGTSTLTKVAKGTTFKIANAQFNIYKSDGTLYRSGIVTDSNGVATAKNLEWGSYYWQEVSSPAGFDLDPNKHAFTIDANHVNAPVTVTSEDPITQCKLTIYKRIKVADINWANHNPTFQFHVSGTDVVGNKHSYNAIISFNQSNTTAGSDGYAVLSTVIDRIPAGTYVVEETPMPMRYAFESVKAVNGSTSGTKATVDLINHNTASVTYQNKVTDWDELTGNANVINNFKK